ncbi:MAG: hypothetical protein J7L15_08330 [Clostridiales bacterium]|nr:hypothetical protein [Clostridiales bacterium]
MRIAKTIKDVVELCSDYEVQILLTDNNSIEFEFPLTNKEKDHKNMREDNFSHIDTKDPIHFTRKTRYVVRSLIDSPRFWRVTTVADQIGRFCLGYKNREETRYGVIKSRKKAKENLKIIFENMKYAKKFFKDLERAN